MYYFFSWLTAILIALMIAVNGGLTSFYDVYFATVLIHIIGLVFISCVVIFRKEPLFSFGKLPLYLFLGGAIGIAATMFNNMAFGKISISAIVALSLLGQAITALSIDHFGLFNMPVKRFSKSKFIGILSTLLGAGYMLYGLDFVFIPVVLSLLSGVAVVTLRSINALLAERTSVLASTWYNYFIGLIGALIIYAIALKTSYSILPTAISSEILIYSGGLIGVCVVILSNIVTTKMPAFQMTLILFAGQIFTGIILDILISNSFSLQNLIGGLCAIFGFSLNAWLDRMAAKNLKQ